MLVGEDGILQCCVGLCTLPFLWLGFSSVPLFWVSFLVSFCCTNLRERTADISKSCWVAPRGRRGCRGWQVRILPCLCVFLICVTSFIPLDHRTGAAGTLSGTRNAECPGGLGQRWAHPCVLTAACGCKVGTRGEHLAGQGELCPAAATRRGPGVLHCQRHPKKSGAFGSFSPPAGPGGSTSSAGAFPTFLRG